MIHLLTTRNTTRSFCLLTAALLASCTPGHHLHKVDEEVYQILKQAENDVYGKTSNTSNFSIKATQAGSSTKKVTNAKLMKISATSGNITLNLAEALQYAVKHSNQYQSQKEALYLTGLNMSDAKIPYGWGQRSSVGVSRDRSSTGTQTLSVDSNQSVNTLFAAGGSAGLTLANDLLKFFTTGADRSIGSVVSFTLMQPLLRGRGAEIAAEGLTQSYRNVIYQMRTYEDFQRTFFREIVIDYLSILRLEQEVDNEQQNLASRKENFEYLKARSIDREAPNEVSDAEQNFLQAEIRLINARSNYASSLDNFKVTLGMPAGMTLTLNSKELERITNAGLSKLNLNEHSAYKLALKNRGSLLNEIDQFEDDRRDVIIAADDLRTQLDFVSNASIANSGDRWERLNFNDISAGVGIELDLPVNRERERNGYRRSLITFHASARSLRQAHDELKNLIRLRLRQLEQFKNNYEIQLGALELAKKQVEGDQLRLKAGTLIFRRLSESQDALIQSRNSVTLALVNYQDSRLRLLSELGILDINKSNFWLK